MVAGQGVDVVPLQGARCSDCFSVAEEATSEASACLVSIRFRSSSYCFSINPQV